jgi:hypothetical protein
MATNTASFLRPGLQTSYEGEAAQLGMEQQLLAQRLAEMEQAKGPSPINAGKFAALDFSGVGNALNEVRTRQKLEAAKKKLADTQGAYQKDLVTSLRKYQESRDGKTVDLAGPPEEGQTGVTGQVPGDPQAYRQGEQSPFSEVRAMAKDDRAAYEKLHDALIKKASPTSALAAGGVTAKLRPAVETVEMNGALVQKPEEAGQGASVVPGTGVTQSRLPSGTVVNNFLGGKQESVDKAPQVHNSLVMPGESALKGIVDKLPDEFAVAKSANNMIRGTETALSALQAGARTGSLEETLQAGRTAVEGLTGLKFASTTPTAVLAKSLAENVVNEFGGKLGTGISNADVAFMQQAMGGLATDKDALERVLAIRAAMAINRIRDHNTNVADLTAQPGFANADYIRKRYAVEPAKFNFVFSSPQARASFEAGISNQPYEKVLRQEGVQSPQSKPPASGLPTLADIEAAIARKQGR